MERFALTNKLPENSQHEEWQAYKNEISKLKIATIKKARHVFGVEGLIWWQDNIYNFCQQIKKNNPDCERYLAWHELIGSSAREDLSANLDFPAPYCIKDFVLKLSAELDLKESKELKN